MYQEQDFFASISREGTDPFAELDTQDDAPAESQPENAEVDKPNEPTDVEEEKPIPYHKDPRWKKQREDLKAEQEARAQAEARAQELEEEIARVRSGGKIEQPEFLTDLVGENEIVARNFQQYEQQLRQRIVEDLRKEEAMERARAAQEEQKGLQWINQSLDEISDEFGVQMRTSTGELTPTAKGVLELINEYPIDDGNGNIDIKKGYEMYNKLKAQEELVKAQKAQVRKDIADSTISKDNSGRTQREYLTQNDLRGKGWNSL